jgi:hypothetical protein
MRTLTPEQRLARGIDFIARAAAATPAGERVVVDTLTNLVVDRPQLLEMSWAYLLQTLVEDGADVDLWSPETRAQLDRRVAAAVRRRDFKGWTPKPDRGGSQHYKPAVVAESP